MASSQAAEEAFVTLATNDTYSLGALVLGHSLRNVHTSRKLAVMISPQVTTSIRQLLLCVFDHVIEVDVMDSRDTQNLALLTRPDLGCTFTKFHCWRLTQFSKCVFLDADTLVLQNVDDLFEREELSAAPDAGWPDCFNSGVFVLVPNEDTYTSLVQFAVSQGSFDGGDQGLLNLYFKDWATKDIRRHLPFTYNVVSQAFYSYLPAFKQFRKDVKIVHFIGAVKPWCHRLDSQGQVQPEAGTGHNVEFLNIWWRIFLDRIQPFLDPSTICMYWQKHRLTLPPSTNPDLFSRPPFLPQPLAHETTPLPQISYTMTLPYRLPDVETFYTPEPSDSRENNDCDPEVYEPQQRDFSYYETHYSEKPMSGHQPNELPGEMYEARAFDEALQDMNVKMTEDHNDDEQNQKTDDQISSKSQRRTSTAADAARSSNPCDRAQAQWLTCGSRDSCDTSLGSECDRQCSACRMTSQTPDLPSPDDQEYSAEAGIIGELANLKLDSGDGGHHPPSPPVNEREWQYAWERGQIDYLGKDSFQQIQRRLDLSTAKPNPQPATTQAKKSKSPPKTAVKK